MSTKEIIRDLLDQLPEDISMDHFMRHLQFVAAVQQGLDELDRGEGIPIEEVEAEMQSWLIR